MPLGNTTALEQHTINSVYSELLKDKLYNNYSPTNKNWINAFKLYEEFHGVAKSKTCTECAGEVWTFLSMNQTSTTF